MYSCFLAIYGFWAPWWPRTLSTLAERWSRFHACLWSGYSRKNPLLLPQSGDVTVSHGEGPWSGRVTESSAMRQKGPRLALRTAIQGSEPLTGYLLLLPSSSFLLLPAFFKVLVVLGSDTGWGTSYVFLWGKKADRINEWTPFNNLEWLGQGGIQVWRARKAELAEGRVISTLHLLAPGPWHLGQFSSASVVHIFSSLQRDLLYGYVSLLFNSQMIFNIHFPGQIM